MTSIGIGDPQILSEANYNFKDFKEMGIDFLAGLLP